MKYKYTLSAVIFVAIEFFLIHFAFKFVSAADDMLVVAGFSMLLILCPFVAFRYVDLLVKWSKGKNV